MGKTGAKRKEFHTSGFDIGFGVRESPPFLLLFAVGNRSSLVQLKRADLFHKN